MRNLSLVLIVLAIFVSVSFLVLCVGYVYFIDDYFEKVRVVSTITDLESSELVNNVVYIENIAKTLDEIIRSTYKTIFYYNIFLLIISFSSLAVLFVEQRKRSINQ